jgi:hypothetical protein
MMLLSLPTAVHAVLMFYLLGACDEEQRKAVASADAAGRQAAGSSAERSTSPMPARLGGALAPT